MQRNRFKKRQMRRLEDFSRVAEWDFIVPK
jgi:hypothetical protein